MYAGSRSVVASLWKVNDEATAELMQRFYKLMLADRLPPATALRSAKVAMWQEARWRSPYFWGAFALAGEYNQTKVMASAKPGRAFGIWVIPAAVTLAVLLALSFMRRRLRLF